MTQLCATVTADSMEELRHKRDQQAGADLVELRLDTPGVADVKAALQGRETAVLVTCRPKWEGGEFDGTEEERRNILLQAVDEGAEYVDVEHNATFLSDVLNAGRGVEWWCHTMHLVLVLMTFMLAIGPCGRRGLKW